LQIAVTINLITTFLLLIMTIIKGPLASLVILIFIYMITIGMTITSTITLGMEKQGHKARSASAVLGMLTLIMGFLLSFLACINGTSAITMGAILFTTSLIGFTAYFTLVKKN